MTLTSSGPGRGQAAGRWAGQLELSERDLAVLRDLARVRLLTGRMVQRLHVHEGSPLTQARRTRSLLQRLSDSRVVTRLERRIGGVSAGSSGFVYGLSAKGQRLVSRRGPAGGRRLRRPWEPSSMFLQHVLAVSQLYVGLRVAEAEGECELLDFMAEPAAWRWWTGPSGERLVLKPDAFVRLGVGEYEYRAFVEVNRSTESSTVVKRKAETYAAYWQSGQEQARSGMFPKVLWAVPDSHRFEQVVGALARLNPDAWQLFQVVRHEQAVAALGGRPPP